MSSYPLCEHFDLPDEAFDLSGLHVAVSLTFVYWFHFPVLWTDKQSNFRNNNVFHELSEQMLPPQVYKNLG